MRKNAALIRVATIARRHVEQLPPEHYWDGEYDWEFKEILGRIAGDGFLLVRDVRTCALSRVAPIAFLDWQLELLGCRWRGPKGEWCYAPTPHTQYSRKAQAAYAALPQLFTEAA